MGGCSLKITQGLHEPIRRDENLRITIPIEVKRLDGYRLEPPGVSRYLDPSCLVTYSAKREILDGSNQSLILLSYASGEAIPLSKERGGFDSLRERHYGESDERTRQLRIYHDERSRQDVG